MTVPGGPHPEDLGRAVEVSQRVYRVLTRAYPDGLRGRYDEEMVRCFGDLCRDELRRRGTKGLAAVWARALPDLVYIALKERSNMLARNAYLPARLAVVTRWGGLSALLGGALGTVASYVGTSVSLPLSLVTLLFSVLLCTLGLFGLYGTLVAASGRPDRPGRLAMAGALLSAASVVGWLAAGASVALGAVWGWAAVPTHAVSAAAFCCWFVGLLLLGIAALGTRLPGRLRALPLVVVALVPLSVLAPAFTSFANPLVVGLPFLGTALLGWALVGSGGAERLAVPNSGAASGMGQTARRSTRATVGRTTSRPQATLTGASPAEAAKEKELLEALARRGKLTVAGTALETSLTVEEAERTLSALAAKGHLQVTVERGRLLYSLWEGDAPR